LFSWSPLPLVAVELGRVFRKEATTFATILQVLTVGFLVCKFKLVWRFMLPETTQASPASVTVGTIENSLQFDRSTMSAHSSPRLSIDALQDVNLLAHPNYYWTAVAFSIEPMNSHLPEDVAWEVAARSARSPAWYSLRH